MGCLTQALLTLLLIGAVAGAIASRFMPWWQAVLVGLSPFLFIAVFALIFLSLIRSFTKGIQDKVGPKKTTLRLKPGEPFRSESIAFTFPVACEVQQMGSMGMEFVGVRPQIEGVDKDLPAMIAAANCISVEDMQAKLEPVLTRAAALPDAQLGEWEVTEQLGMTGKRRELRSVKDGRHLRAEMVFLGHDKFVLGWIAGAREEAFESVASQVRAMAASVECAPVADSKMPE